jgi:alkylation response protein AidB-like acyl-CoA dehydrogenase
VDFDLTDEQREIRELAARIFGDLADHAHQRAVEAAAGPDGAGPGGEQGDPRFDRRLWSALAEAGLLALAVPEEHGGAGLGFLEQCLVIERAGEAAAPVPLTAATVFGILPVVRFGTEELRTTWLGRAGGGEVVLSAALGSPLGDPLEPPATAAPDGGQAWRLSGTLAQVPAGMAADAVVVAARAERGTGLFLVEAEAPGVRRHPQRATDGRVEAEIVLDGTPVAAGAVLVAPGEAGDAAHQWCAQRAQAALCVEVAGASRAALDLTARYCSQRVQFGKPVATFQAVGQRAADAYIDTEAVRLTAWQAAWRLDRDLPAAAATAVAKFWADDGAQRVVHAAQHLHGGVGVDRDYPLHRYYLLVKHLAPTLGGATASLLRLGRVLADTPV